MSGKRCIIVGASHAGAMCALSLRRQGWSGAITLIGEESNLPYHRPPLSKDYLKGTKDASAILLNGVDRYEKADVDLQLGQRVESIDRDAQAVTTADGRRIEYDKLVLATGSRAVELPFVRTGLKGVHYLRSIGDVDRMRDDANNAGRAVIIGGGYIGLEAAASLRSMDIEVTVLEAADRILQRVTSAPVSTFFSRVHREEGVDLREQCAVSGLIGEDSIEGVELSSGERIDTDIVVIGVGVRPCTRLAEEAGLSTDNGIQIDEFARTSDPNILAVGDCTSFLHPRYRARMRLESVQNANDQALVAAKSLVGDPAPYDSVPWFWSDQFDVKLQIAGLAQSADQIIVRGDPTAGRSMSVAYLRDGKLLAIDAMNRPRDFVQGKKLIMADATVDPELAANPDIELVRAEKSAA